MTLIRTLVVTLVATLLVTSFRWAAAEGSEPDVTFYRSNEIGIPFEKILKEQVSSNHFVLVHLNAVVNGSAEEYLLLEEGRQVRRWVTRRDKRGDRLSESSYVGGQLVDERRFDSMGRLIGSAAYENGALVSRSTYEYQPRLVSVEAVGPDGSLQFQASYRLAATGNIRDFTRSAQDEDQTGARFVFVGGDLLEEVITTGSTRIISRYLSGEPYQVEEWREGRLHLVLDIERSVDGVLIAKTSTEPERERLTQTRFDSAGRVMEVLITERGLKRILIQHTRDAAGRVVMTLRQSGDDEERWYYYYVHDGHELAISEVHPDKQLRSQRYEQDGLLVSVTTFDVDGSHGEVDVPSTWQVEFYREGVPVRREYYRQGERVKEQVLLHGQVVRERAFD